MRLRDRIGQSLFVLFVVVYLLPFLWLVLASFKEPKDAFASPPVWIFQPTLMNYISTLAQPAFVVDFKNSVITAIGSTGLSLVFAIPGAYAYTRHRARYTNATSMIVFGTQAIPSIVFVVPFYLIFRSLLGTQIPIILAHTTFTLPMCFFFIASYLADLPIELEEASFLDGCTRWQSFVRIVVPLVLPAIASASVISFVLSWNELLFAVILTTASTRTLPVSSQGVLSQMYVTSWGTYTALGVMEVIPPIVFAFFVQKQLVRGLTMGAVKGVS